jgi:hypothetical protein
MGFTTETTRWRSKGGFELSFPLARIRSIFAEEKGLQVHHQSGQNKAIRSYGGPRVRISFPPARSEPAREDPGMSDAVALVEYAGDIRRSPESRLAAGHKALAILASFGEQRQKLPRGLTREYARACAAGLGSVRWRDPYHYASLLSTRLAPGTPHAQGVAREVPPPR